MVDETKTADGSVVPTPLGNNEPVSGVGTKDVNRADMEKAQAFLLGVGELDAKLAPHNLSVVGLLKWAAKQAGGVVV